MKIRTLFASAMASLLIAGCSQDEVAPVDGGGNDGNGEANISYMAVNLVSSDVTGSRAATGYEDGSKKENAVTNVRFYFFNGLGGAVNVKLLDGNKVNYYDWTPAEGDQTRPGPDSDDIESILKATIVINTEEGDGIPQRIAAVLNPIGLDNESKNLTKLKEIVADYATTELTSEGKFVMFNSVGGGGKDFSTTLIEDKNLCKSKDDAISNPVTIYVERSVAKVRVTLDDKIGFTNNKLALKDKDGNELKVEGQQVYLQLDAWDLTAETDESRLVKKINSAWEGDWWYTAYRSFWAINSMTAENQYYPYNTGIVSAFGKDNVLYTNENAQKTDIDINNNTITGNAEKSTKFILKGKLCKADGSAFTIARHLGVYFADDDNQTQLKKSILNQLAANGLNYYYDVITEDEGKTKTERKQIDVADLQIVVVEQEQVEESDNNCYVCAQLTTDAAKKEWYNSLTAESPITDGSKVINDILKYKKGQENVVDKALIWKSGMTYYFDEIKHLNNETGVVRNHIYEINITKIAGLGTPVYDPDKVIYPEHPEENNHYIAAEINILSWRVVKNDYELVW